VNPLGGRDHWPHGFSMALAGGGIQSGRVIGQTSPELNMDKERYAENVVDACELHDMHATVFHLLGIDFQQTVDTPVGRPMVFSEGKVIKELLAS
jgi:hypothetical protein